MLRLLGIFDLVPGWIYVLVIALLTASSTMMGWAWLGARDRAVELTTQRDQANSAASLCSESVKELQRLAAKRLREGQPAIAAAVQKAQAANLRSDEILAAPPSTPGDDCKSAQDQVNDWLANRRPHQ